MTAPTRKLRRQPVTCPACGHHQDEYTEPDAAFCHACGHRFPLKERRSSYRTPKATIERREVPCYHCLRPLFIPASALSWQCQHCSGYLDLKNYTVDTTLSASLRTYGDLTVSPRGTFAGVRAEAYHITIRGRAAAFLVAHRRLTLSGDLQTITGAEAPECVIEPGTRFRAEKSFTTVNLHVEGRVRIPQVRCTGILRIATGGALECNTLEYNGIRVYPGGSLWASDIRPCSDSAPAETA
jgi:ribosomal protein L37AE/L43A